MAQAVLARVVLAHHTVLAQTISVSDQRAPPLIEFYSRIGGILKSGYMGFKEALSIRGKLTFAEG